MGNPRFAETVRNGLEANRAEGRKPDSVRSLGRSMADIGTKTASVYTRSLFRWLQPDGPAPTSSSRALVFAALGRYVESDDEEEDELADLLRMCADLNARIADAVKRRAKERSAA